MSVAPLDVLLELSTDWAPTPGDVWQASPFHVDGMHGSATAVVRRDLTRLVRTRQAQLGVVLCGQRGAGKTHLLGWVREQIQADDGYFFLVTLHDGVDFWESVLHCMVEGLLESGAGRESQLRVFLRRLAAAADMPDQIQQALAGDMAVPPDALNIFVDAFRARWPDLGAECHETLRALVLRASKNVEALDVGRAYLQGREETEAGERRHWGIAHREAKNAQWIIEELLRLLALTGPTVIAVDQIDHLVAKYGTGTVNELFANALSRDDRQLNLIASGLLDLRERAARSLCVVSCLHSTWQLISSCAIDTVADRFRHVIDLGTIPSAEVAEELVAKRFSHTFTSLKFGAPYPTWPIKPMAFGTATQYTPRGLLQRVDEHLELCLKRGAVIELANLEEDAAAGSERSPQPVAGNDFDELDQRFRELCAQADVAAALDAATEDQAMPALLAAGLRCWIDEEGDNGQGYSLGPPAPGKNSLHGLLRRTINDELEDEAHWAFRGIASTNARAALTRLRDASDLSGIRAGGTARKLIIIRRGQWSEGQQTRLALELLEAAGGTTIRVDPADLAVFDALRRLREQPSTRLTAWLSARRPAHNTGLLIEALGDGGAPAAAVGQLLPPTGRGYPPPMSGGESSAPALAQPKPATPTNPAAPPIVGPIVIGTAADTGEAMQVDLSALRKHVVVFAGSGSGKTVLIRRLVEECALRGVSAIVLDPGNDLARLGDSWPAEPAGWHDLDKVRAADYLANTDVVVWTPRQPNGRPLTFQPLPDFNAVQGDDFELLQAVDAAVAMLAPRAKVATETVKSIHGRAVLHQAMTHFARKGHSGLRSYVAMLAALPDDASDLPDAGKAAADMAKTLSAAMVLDPLFGGAGTPVDPGILLTPAPGKRARVSIINFVGLLSEEQRQSFVNQLQLGLFTWLKQHPAPDGHLGGLLVMDEAQTFAPSKKATTCSRSTIMLVTQARKYGLGLVFGTQGPKDLDNHIPSNAATQFFGRLSAGAPVDAAKAIAQGKGSPANDFASLGTGTFYISAEADGFRKMQTAMCLTYHAGALTADEITSRARATG
jgi:hypothetical protein